MSTVVLSYRVIRYGNSFLPLISGHVAPVASGSRIDLMLRLTAPVAVFMVIWLAVAFAGATAGVLHSILTSQTRGLLGLALPLFGCGLVAVGFIPEKMKSHQATDRCVGRLSTPANNGMQPTAPYYDRAAADAETLDG